MGIPSNSNGPLLIRPPKTIHTRWHSIAGIATYSVSSIFIECRGCIHTEYGSSPAWNKIVPLNGTELLSLSNFDLKGWPLPLDCSATLGGALNYSHSAYFVLNNQDPRISAKTWTASTETSTTSSSVANLAATTATLSSATPTSVASVVTIAAIATPTPLTDTATNSQGSGVTVSKGTIAGATIGGLVVVGLCFVAFTISRHLQARRAEKGQNKVHESRENESNDASTHWKPEMPADNHPQLLHEMPLDQNPGYSLAPSDVHNVETREMPATSGSRASRSQEMPATPMLRM